MKHFKGDVVMYNETYYVDTETGEGVDRVLKKIDPLLTKKASVTYLPGFSSEDIKQELVIMVIKGIRSYDPTKGTALSTFLHQHLRNKVISRLKSGNKMANDAELMNGTGDPGKLRRIKEELPFSTCPVRYDDSDEILFESTIEDSDNYLNMNKRFKSNDDINFEVSIKKFSKELDPDTAQLLKLVCFHDYTIKDAAEKVGLSGWAASIRLKKLLKRQGFKTIIGRE